MSSLSEWKCLSHHKFKRILFYSSIFVFNFNDDEDVSKEKGSNKTKRMYSFFLKIPFLKMFD